ncbi:IS4 family transposase [Cetobacterium sp.]|uniref:IS4 family transposase n=1 Tax=Cetobacterium sp. TaxID=2071632 RepID=UPI003F347A15
MKSKCLNFLLNEEEINRIAKEVGLCKRIRKFSPIQLLKMVILSPNNITKDILSHISLNLFEIENLSVSSEAINKRFNSKFVKFLKAIFLRLLNIILDMKKPEKKSLAVFNRILLTDSSVSKLHRSLAKDYPGGKNQEGEYSSLKINFIKDLKHNLPVDVKITAGTKNDFKFLPKLKKIIRAKDLILNDLGYYSLDFFKYILKKKAFFISKLKLNSTKTIFVNNPDAKYFKNGNVKSETRYVQLDLETICSSMNIGEIKEVENVYVGSAFEKVPCRLIITRLDGVLEERRLKTVTKKIRDPRPYLREEKRDIAKYGFIITNLPKKDYPKKDIYPIYSLRWQIELDFKNWKSILEIDESTRKLKKERIEVHFYGKLCNILMNNELSNILREEIEDKSLIFSEKKIFQKIKYYLDRIHHYDYKVFRIIDKLKILVPKTCIKSRRKGEFSSDDILKLII